MTTKHTPGPWIWTDRFYTMSGEPCMTLLGDNESYGILCTDGISNSPQGIGNEANARLIAAAPELLEALREIMADLDANYGCITQPHERIGRARAAISKATGTNQ